MLIVLGTTSNSCWIREGTSVLFLWLVVYHNIIDRHLKCCTLSVGNFKRRHSSLMLGYSCKLNDTQPKFCSLMQKWIDRGTGPGVYATARNPENTTWKTMTIFVGHVDLPARCVGSALVGQANTHHGTSCVNNLLLGHGFCFRGLESNP